MSNPTIGGGGLRAATLLSTLALLLGLCGASAPTATALTNPDPNLIALYEPCAPNTGVTVIVDFQTLRTAPGDEPVYVGCAPGEQASGFAALQSAGFAPQGTERWGPAFVCRLLGLPSPGAEPCVNTPPANAYWSYWKSRPGGQWAYSAFGSTDSQNPVPLGSVEGWSFSTVTPSPPPRLAPLDASGPGELTLTVNPDSREAAAAAHQWLLGQAEAILADTTLTGRAKIAKAVGSGVFLALASGAGDQAETAGLSALLTAGARDYVSKGTEGSVFADLLSQVVLAVTARGDDPTSVAGENLRAELIGLLAGPASGVEGKVQNRSLKKGVPTYAHTPITVNTQALAVLALARSGGVPEAAVGYLLSTQQANGSFSSPLTTAAALRPDTALAIVALAGARDSGGTGLEAPIARAAAWLAGFQRVDGGVLNAGTAGQPETVGTELTALAGRAFAAAGETERAQRAAAYLSSLQLVAAYAGDGAGKTDLGAVAPSPAGLKEALRYGIASAQRDAFRASSAQALLGLEAGPYWPPEPDPGPENEPPPTGNGPGDGHSVPSAPGDSEQPPATSRPGSVAPREGARPLASNRVAVLATLTCRAEIACQVLAPRRVRVQIAGRHYGAWVSAPLSLVPGESAELSVRLTRRAAAALAGVSAVVRVRVWLGDGRNFEVQEIEARVAGVDAPATAPLTKKEMAR